MQGEQLIVENAEEVEIAATHRSCGKHVESAHRLGWGVAEQAFDFLAIGLWIRPEVVGGRVGVAVEQGDDVEVLDHVVEEAALLGRPPVPIKIEALTVTVMLPDDNRFAGTDLLEVLFEELQRVERIIPTARAGFAIGEWGCAVG